MKHSISILGAGNVGHHLALRLYQCGHEIVQVFSRNLDKAQQLCSDVEAEAINDIKAINMEATLYIIAIKDNYIDEFQESIRFLEHQNKLVVHTSGAVSSTVFSKKFSNYGVFYPLQTFSKVEPTNFETLPFCIYANTRQSEDILFDLATSICPNVFRVDDEKRAILHVAAVFVNNFSNYMYDIAYDICKDHQLPFDLLKALIKKTANNIDTHVPEKVQTGPAKRGDKNSMDKHLRMLENYPDYKTIYTLLSEGILKKHQD